MREANQSERYAAVVVELRRLSQLLVLADELNFHRAAARLHMSQPALSRSIRNLELEVGVPLVERSTRTVGLTEAGAQLVESTRPLMGSLTAAVERIQVGFGDQRTTLRVGFKAGTAGGLVTPVVRAFEEANPDVEVVVRRLSWLGQVSALLDRRVDLAFLASIEKLDERLEVHEVGGERRMLVVPLDHPLAGAGSVSIEDVAADPVVVSRSVPAAVGRWWAAIPRPGGADPPMGPAVDSVEEALEAVARGRGVCFVARSVAVFYGRPDVAFLPVEDLEDVPIALAWRRGEEQPAFLDFLARARDLANSDALTASIAAQQTSPPAI